MTNDRVFAALDERFYAPKPEYYKRRIIFWYDEDKEFTEEIGEYMRPNIKVVVLTGKNNFAVKKQLLHDDPESDYLIYVPFEGGKTTDDWLCDIALYSEEYRADLTSLRMADFHISNTPELRQAVKRYDRFFNSKERCNKLKALGRSYSSIGSLQLDIMAVLAGSRAETIQHLLIDILRAGLDETENEPLNAIGKFGSLEDFKEIVHRCTGYEWKENAPLRNMMIHILCTAMLRSVDVGKLKGQESYLDESGKGFCYNLFDEWCTGPHGDSLYQYCRNIESELRLHDRFSKMDIDVLLQCDIFPAVDDCLLVKLFKIASDIDRRQPEKLAVSAELRRGFHWYSSSFYPYYDCITAIAKMQMFRSEHYDGFHWANAEEAWKFYRDEGWMMDAVYRSFHHAYRIAVTDGENYPDDALKEALDNVENLYQNWFLYELNSNWSNMIADDMHERGTVRSIPRQRDFYDNVVKDIVRRKSKAYVIISDALRYETAMELKDKLGRDTGGVAEISAYMGIFPSITKFGMTALLPGQHIAVDDQMNVLIDGNKTGSTEDRKAILCSADSESTAVAYEDIITLNQQQLREQIGGKNVVYIYHNQIDAIGDKKPTEKQVFEACEKTIDDLFNLVKILMNNLSATHIFITADHGFLYSYRKLNEYSKFSLEGKGYERGRRYLLDAADSSYDYLLDVNLTSQIEGKAMKGYALRDASRFKVAGGGENFVHGGLSLQEICVPLVRFHNVRVNSKKYSTSVPATLQLSDMSRKISNRDFSLHFLQPEPVGEKVVPCEYKIWVQDENGNPVSTTVSIMADKKDIEQGDRIYYAQFTMKPGTYNKHKEYKLVISNGTDIPEEIPFTVDILDANNYGFF